MANDQEALDMLLAYPFILPITPNLHGGYLTANAKDYYIKFEVHPQHPSGITLIMTDDLKQFEDQLANLPPQTSKLKFLDNLTRLLTKRIANPTINFTNSYWHVLTEYVELREFYINMRSSFLSQDLSRVTLSYGDEVGRLHPLVIGVNLVEARFEVVEHSLPENGVLFERGGSSLKAIYETFIGHVNSLQKFFDSVDALDQNCWVLDPVAPTTKDCFRRIGLDDNVSMIVTIKPWVDNSIPDIKVLGPDRLIINIKAKVRENLINWDTNADFMQQLLKLLELDNFIPRPVQRQTEVLLCNSGECCICFSERLNDNLPEIVCQNASCEQLFHRECLYEWLMSVNARPSFNALHGNCPNCEKIISCPV